MELHSHGQLASFIRNPQKCCQLTLHLRYIGKRMFAQLCAVVHGRVSVIVLPNTRLTTADCTQLAATQMQSLEVGTLTLDQYAILFQGLATTLQALTLNIVLIEDVVHFATLLPTLVQLGSLTIESIGFPFELLQVLTKCNKLHALHVRVYEPVSLTILLPHLKNVPNLTTFTLNNASYFKRDLQLARMRRCVWYAILCLRRQKIRLPPEMWMLITELG